MRLRRRYVLARQYRADSRLYSMRRADSAWSYLVQGPGSPGMTDWTGGPDPEHDRELAGDWGRLDEPAEQEDPVAEEPDLREPGYIERQGEFSWNRKVGD